MLIKNQIYEAVISDYTSQGQGIAKIEGCAVFIPNAMMGERVRVRIEKLGEDVRRITITGGKEIADLSL